MAANLLAQKAVLADVTIHHWTGRKLDKEITDETNKRHNAQEDAGRYNKLLISQEAFNEVYSINNAARTKHRLMTMPWSDAGLRILPATMYDEFAKTFRNYRNDFDTAADSFARNYPNYVNAAKKRLNGMFKADDYPHPNRVRGMFSFHVSVRPVPDMEDFRVSVAQEHAEDMRNNLRADMEAALNDVMKEPVRRIIERVGHMATKLKQYKPKAGAKRAENTFRDSLVNNVRELMPLLNAFNLTGDKSLGELIKRVEKELTVVDAEVLREDTDTRKAVAKAAEAILKDAQALMS